MSPLLTTEHFERLLALENNLQSLDRDTLTANPVCHPQAGFELRYTRGDGFVSVLCTQCHRKAFDLALVSQPN